MRNIYTTTAFTGSATTTIGTSNVFVHTVIIPKTTAGTVTLEATDGTDYFVFPASTVAGSYLLDTVFSSGLKITTSGADTGAITWGQ